MAIELKQQLKLSQQLVMTPQLQQAIKLLQLSRLDLVTMVNQELQENPVLEDGVDGEEELPTEVREESEAPDEALSDASAEHAEAGEPTDLEKIADVDWQNYMDAFPQTGMGVVRDDEERPSFEATLTRRETLTEHLEWQLQMAGVCEETKQAASWIIGNLDERGYLVMSLEDIAEQSGLALDVLQPALIAVQGFDPVGVAARDLSECLMLQLDAQHVRDPLVRALASDYLDELQKKDYKKIAKARDVSVDEVARAARVLAQLEPRPGRPFGGDEPVYITPDIYVYRVADDYHILLNEDGLPKLRINNMYRGVLAQGRGEVPKETREYVQEKVRSAVWLIKSIHQRQRTIYKVMQSILKHQREFFDRGITHLKPLNLRDVAEDIEMHESTVSRVTSNKYANTPQGIFPLKYFFNSSISRVDGDAIASESVKEKIRKIVAAEDQRRPLSDQRISEMLRRLNIDIARRTVTKYRESMNIL
ncbi:MAG: RNA polymerase factor sigma-54, partial [Myxococcales bacterium]|nr:RNA polymerase factor sigma-54 [Myxococcales bacterium]